MRKRNESIMEIFNECILKYYNYTFLNYINKLYNQYKNNSIEDDDFTIPGRIEISIDGISSYIDITSDVLIALYNIIKIRTDQLENKYEGGENVDLYQYIND